MDISIRHPRFYATCTGADPGFVVRGGAWVGEGSGDRMRSPSGPGQSPGRRPRGPSPPETLGVWGMTSSNNKTLTARLLARVLTGCHYTSCGTFFFFFRFPSTLGAHFFFPPPILSWPWNSSTNLNESGICTLELYTKIFAEPARADRVAIKLRKINSIMSCRSPYMVLASFLICADHRATDFTLSKTFETARWKSCAAFLLFFSWNRVRERSSI